MLVQTLGRRYKWFVELHRSMQRKRPLYTVPIFFQQWISIDIRYIRLHEAWEVTVFHLCFHKFPMKVTVKTNVDISWVYYIRINNRRNGEPIDVAIFLSFLCQNVLLPVFVESLWASKLMLYSKLDFFERMIHPFTFTLVTET